MLTIRDETVKLLLGVAVGFGLGATTTAVVSKLRASSRRCLHPSRANHDGRECSSSPPPQPTLNAEERSLLEGGPRVKFTTLRLGTITDYLANRAELRQCYEETCAELANQMQELERCGVTPVAPDGKVGGNCSALLRDQFGSKVVVSKSGKLANTKMDVYEDFVLIENFDMDSWSCRYYSNQADTLPTSDAPLHFTILCGTPEECSTWSEYPTVVLHGHAFETEEKAEACGYPISTRETLFSTPEDTSALLELLRRYAYPQHKIYVRKGHGFLLLAANTSYSARVFQQEMKCYLE